MVRRFAMLALFVSLLLGFSGSSRLFALDDAKKDEAKKDEPKKDEPKKDEAKKDEPKKEEAPKEEPLPPIPPEVEKKLEAARRAVAEAIVACEDAGLVKTTISPPPILDILLTGRATDESTLKAKKGVSPEVFAAWFTGQGKSGLNIVPQNDVRITQPSQGLKTLFDQRASLFNKEIDAIRKTKADAAKAETTKAEETKKAAAMKIEEAKKAEEAKKKADEEAKKAEAMKAEEAKKKAEAMKAEEAKKKAEEAKKKADDDKKAEEAKKKADDDKKAEEAKKKADDDKKAEEAKKKVDDDKKADGDKKADDAK